MRIWYDACTGKHVRYGLAIARRLRKSGHEVVFTTRQHPDTIALAKTLGIDPIVVGTYDPTSLFTRLEQSAKRIIKFSKMFEGNLPQMAICHQSVELCRSAFGFNVPVIVTADTPYASAVNRLTVPLANTLLISEAIPKELFTKYGPRKVVQFKGVDEVAWVKDSNPHKPLDFERPLIVVRQSEVRAAYAVGAEDVTIKAAELLSAFGNVVFLPRYSKLKNSKFRVVDEFVDSSILASQADLVVGVGGTIIREAALGGTPSIVLPGFGRIEVNEYLSKRGFPIYWADSLETLASFAKNHIGRRVETKSKLADLENPVDVIEKILNEDYSA